MSALYMCFGMKGVAFLCALVLCALRRQAVISGDLIREDSVGGRGVLGLAPPRTEIPMSLKHESRVPTAALSLSLQCSERKTHFKEANFELTKTQCGKLHFHYTSWCEEHPSRWFSVTP